MCVGQGCRGRAEAESRKLAEAKAGFRHRHARTHTRTHTHTHSQTDSQSHTETHIPTSDHKSRECRAIPGTRRGLRHTQGVGPGFLRDQPGSDTGWTVRYPAHTGPSWPEPRELLGPGSRGRLRVSKGPPWAGLSAEGRGQSLPTGLGGQESQTVCLSVCHLSPG